MFSDSVKVAAEEEDHEDEEEGEDEVKENKAPMKKEGAHMSGLYESYFPEDEMAESGFDKEASYEMEKIAAEQESLGALAYDFFTSRFDDRITKLAEEVAHAITEGDREPAAQLDNNKKGGNARIDTTPEYQDQEMMVEHGQAVVGQESMAKAAAYRKAWLLSQLED